MSPSPGRGTIDPEQECEAAMAQHSGMGREMIVAMIALAFAAAVAWLAYMAYLGVTGRVR